MADDRTDDREQRETPPPTTPAGPSPERQQEITSERDQAPGTNRDALAGGERPSRTSGATSETVEEQIRERRGEEEPESPIPIEELED